MRAGTMRHRLVVQTKASSGDGMGGVTESWTDGDEVMASIWPIEGAERIAAMQLEGKMTHQIRIRYVEGITPDTRLRLADSTMYYDVTSVSNRNLVNRELRLYCKSEA